MKFSHSWRRYRKTILALFFCSALSSAQAVDFMPVQDVQTGMEGIAKTVIVGDTISNFNVKVLGVMKDKCPDGPLSFITPDTLTLKFDIVSPTITVFAIPSIPVCTS